MFVSGRLATLVALVLLIASLPACAGSGERGVVPNAFDRPFIASRASSTESAYATAYQLNAQHTGAIEARTLHLPVKISWKATLVPSGRHVNTYPLIVKNVVYLGGSHVYALNGSTGAKVWGDKANSVGLAYANNQVFTVTTGGTMTAYRLDGQQSWATHLPNQWLFSSPPTAGNGMVYTGGAGDGGTLYAVEQRSGKLVWSAEVENGDDSSPVVTSTGVYVSYSGPQTYDFNPLKGKQIWYYSCCSEGGGGSTPVLYGGDLYTESAIGPDGVVNNALNGKERETFAGSVTPAFAHGVGYFIDGSASSSSGTSTLYAINVSKHRVLWKAAPAGESFSVPPIVLEDTSKGDLVVCATAKTLYVYSANTGATLQKIQLSASRREIVEGGLAYSQGLLVVPLGPKVVGLR